VGNTKSGENLTDEACRGVESERCLGQMTPARRFLVNLV
jgi:hypothetical protein